MKIGEHEITKKTLTIGIIVVIVVVIGAVLSPYVLFGAGNDSMIYIRKGMTKEAVADSLRVKLGDGFGGRVNNLLTWSNSDLSKRQGAFKVRHGESALKVAHHLRSGAPSGIKFTFNNVRTKDEWAKRVGQLFMMGYDGITKALNDKSLCAKFGKTPDNITTILIPDSYEFYWDITPEELLSKMNGYYKDFWNSKRLAKAAALNLSPDDVEIIASIVEEETAKQDERGKVARLYMNRLKSGMPLQADPTVKFALGNFALKRITVDMTRFDSPYNTYRNIGLPPGPIRMPEKSTIDAVLNAPMHNYMYMCAKEDFSGYHNFTTDYNEHLANAKRYRAALDSRGIK